MRKVVRISLLCAAFSLLPVTLLAQAAIPASITAGGAPGSTSTGDEFEARAMGARAHKTIGGRVVSPQGRPLANAQVQITNNAGAAYQSLVTDKYGDFQADFSFFSEEMDRHFVAVLKISKKGFQVAHRVTEMEASVNSLNLDIHLQTLEQQDPSLLSESDLINGVAPKLRQLGPADGLSPKQQKDYDRGVRDFLDRHRLDDAVPRLAKVAMLNPTCLRCRTMLSLAELSWGDWDDPPRELADSINALIKDKKLGCPEPLLVYGVLLSWKHEADHAAPFFTEALKYAPHDPLVLQELGRVQYMGMDWWGANESLKQAVDAGAGPDARLMRAEALLWVGTAAAAMAELNLYLNGRNIKSMPPRVRTLWERIQSGKKDEAIVAALKAKAKARGQETLDYLHHPPQKLADLEPAPDQKPLAAILEAVGKNVAQFFADLPNICSLEKVNQERLNREGKTDRTQERTYRYLLTMPDQKFGPAVDEYRADPKGKLTSQPGLDDNYMLTEGFVSAPLVFHPAYQSGSSFRLLGTQKVKGRKTYVIVYAQEPTKSRLSGTFVYGATVRPTFTQGMAWVDAENYQIIRLVSDLLEPLPLLRLDKETTDINFGEVHFKQAPRSFWLPKAVTVTLDWNSRLLRNDHAYSDFLVSNVESTQRISRPKNADKIVEEVVEPDTSANPVSHAMALVPSKAIKQ